MTDSATQRGVVILWVLWLGVVACAVAVVWTLPTLDGATAARWFFTGVVLLVALCITGLVAL